MSHWHYLIVTASNEAQADAYRRQMSMRRDLGLLADVGDVRVVPDPGGRRVGSGGSTVACLAEVLSARLSETQLTDPSAWRAELAQLRILIVHGGGDSRRLPAYGPCGKIFVPIPGESDSALGQTLFDRQLPTYLALPPTPDGAGQVVITSGDVLLTFDPRSVRLDAAGAVGLAVAAAPDAASRHGVYCCGGDRRVTQYLQKPSVTEQQRAGATDRDGRSLLDIGVISLDAQAAAALMAACSVAPDDSGALTWSGPVAEAIDCFGLDVYREVCCALGAEATPDAYRAAARAGGSEWPDDLLETLYTALHPVPLTVCALDQCGFMHFGTTRQIITSGAQIVREDRGVSELGSALSLCTNVGGNGEIRGVNAWVEGCRITAPLRLGGGNVVVGLDVDQPLTLAAGACIDVLAGSDRDGGSVWFVRCCGVDDTFKTPLADGATFCGMAMNEWLDAAGAGGDDVWDADVPDDQRTLWNARLFPAVAAPDGWSGALWMFDPAAADDERKAAWRAGPRYSSADIALLTDQPAFHARRMSIRAREIRTRLPKVFRKDSNFSAADLTVMLTGADRPAALAADVLAEAARQGTADRAAIERDGFTASRILHSLASAIEELGETDSGAATKLLQGLRAASDADTVAWLKDEDLLPGDTASAAEWIAAAKRNAFARLGRAILTSAAAPLPPPRSAVREDEIVWGRAPARLDLGGGWTDTPPQALEHGGRVLNAAVDLNGQPPIHAYARVIPEPVITISSIDQGSRVRIEALEQLLDYRDASGEFSLAKAALAVSGLSPESADWPTGTTLETMLNAFGGGIELTTLAAIPKGSGLGTSSIVGAVLLAAITRLMGRKLSKRDLFHGVLRLEQALTTGGGWQDQIGGAVDGVKIITAEAGLVPDPSVRYIPPDVLAGGHCLLYYTGITRLAKNILQEVVGAYLNRRRSCVRTLADLRASAAAVAEAMSRKDPAEFGHLVGEVWRLNKQLDPHATNEQVELLMDRIAPHVYGAKLLGAGGGGFMLMVCRSPQDASVVRDALTDDPPNDRARFFDFAVSTEGLVVTIC